MSTIPIIIGISGGIAAYKVPQLLRDLIREGYAPVCVMSKQSLRFVTKETIQAVTQRPVWVDGDDSSIDHIKIARHANIFLVVPCTANMMAKFSHGLSDDLLSTVYLAFKGSVLIAPAMHTEMWEHPATQENAKVLSKRHGPLLGPIFGDLSCGDKGLGRLVDFDIIRTAVNNLKDSMPNLSNQNILLVFGPCKESIDPVRCISNRSSGKMGIELLKVLQALGANLTTVSSISFSKDYGVDHSYQFESHQDLEQILVHQNHDYDHLIMLAAVSDFSPKEQAAQKMSRSGDLTIAFESTRDILKQLGDKKSPDQNIVGFCLTDQNKLESLSHKKRLSKNCNYVVGNTAAALGADFRDIVIYSKENDLKLTKASTEQAARFIVKNCIS